MFKTDFGKLSAVLIALFFSFMVVFFYFVELGYRGGDTFFSNLYLTIPFLLAVVCAVSSLFVGVISVFKFKERNVLVYLCILIGLFVFWFVLMEILFPH